MKLSYIFIAGLLVIFLAFVTNPSQAEYVEWAQQEFKNENGALAGFVAGPVISNFTSNNNYGVLTIYETALKEDAEKKLIVLGVFNQFFWINK